MSAPGIVQNLIVQTANLQNLVSWDLSTGATSYIIQRSLDNVTYTTIATVSGSPLATSYIDSAVTAGTQYWYQVSAYSGAPVSSSTSGQLYMVISLGTATLANWQSVNSAFTSIPAVGSIFNATATLSVITGSPTIQAISPFTTPQSIIPAPTGEWSLGALRIAAQQRADRVNSQFITTSEWNSYIKQAMFELYDLLVTCYEDYFLATPLQFTADGVTFQFPLPNGVNSYYNGITLQPGYIAPPFYKIMGVDLALNNANNSYVTINKFNFIDRNRFVYPNTASTIYGVFNLQYRVLGNVIEFIPTPAGGQGIRIWYIPRMTELLADTDTTNFGISGWNEYVIVRAAKYALDKEESDTSILTQEIAFLKARIEETASNRDAGQPDRISDTRSGNGNGWGTGGFGSGYNGGTGGW